MALLSFVLFLFRRLQNCSCFTFLPAICTALFLEWHFFQLLFSSCLSCTETFLLFCSTVISAVQKWTMQMYKLSLYFTGVSMSAGKIDPILKHTTLTSALAMGIGNQKSEKTINKQHQQIDDQWWPSEHGLRRLLTMMAKSFSFLFLAPTSNCYAIGRSIGSKEGGKLLLLLLKETQREEEEEATTGQQWRSTTAAAEKITEQRAKTSKGTKWEKMKNNHNNNSHHHSCRCCCAVVLLFIRSMCVGQC